jgi:Uma2 family endonuclease
MNEPALRRMSVDEFLLWDDGSSQRYELVDGHAVAMAPTREAHGAITARAIVEIDRRLKPPCRTVAEAGIAVDDANFYIADVAVTCSPPSPQGMLQAPVLVVEVLSPSTRGFDLGIKADAYSTLPSVREVWLIDGERRWVRLWRREGEHWIVSLPIQGQGTFASQVLDAEITLDSLYLGSGL